MWAGLKQQDWQGTFGTSVLTLKSETAAAKLYMSIIGNLNNRDRIRLSELVKLLLANVGWCKCVAAFSY